MSCNGAFSGGPRHCWVGEDLPTHGVVAKEASRRGNASVVSVVVAMWLGFEKAARGEGACRSTPRSFRIHMVVGGPSALRFGQPTNCIVGPGGCCAMTFGWGCPCGRLPPSMAHLSGSSLGCVGLPRCPVLGTWLSHVGSARRPDRGGGLPEQGEQKDSRHRRPRAHDGKRCLAGETG